MACDSGVLRFHIRVLSLLARQRFLNVPVMYAFVAFFLAALISSLI